MVSEPVSGLCRTLAAGRAGRSCKLPARLKEYVLPGKDLGSRKASTRHQAAPRRPASQADELCPTASHIQQHPPPPAKRIIVKLSLKASGTGQGRAPHPQANQASPATRQQAGCKPQTANTPPVDATPHTSLPSRAPTAKPFRVAPVERPVTRRFSLQQRSSSKLKLRIKLKRSTATGDQQPSRLSSLQHQQKRHANTLHNTAKQDSSLPVPAASSPTVLHQPAASKAPACAQVQNPMAAQFLATAAVAAPGSVTEHAAPTACGQPAAMGDHSRPGFVGTSSSNTFIAADAHSLPVAALVPRAEASALCCAVEPQSASAVCKTGHSHAEATPQHVGAATLPYIKQKQR